MRVRLLFRNDIAVDRFDPRLVWPRPFVCALSLHTWGEERRIIHRNNRNPSVPISANYTNIQTVSKQGDDPTAFRTPLTREGGLLCVQEASVHSPLVLYRVLQR